MPKWTECERDAEDVKAGWRVQLPKGPNARWYKVSDVDVKVHYIYITCDEAIEPFRVKRNLRLIVATPSPTHRELVDQAKKALAWEWRRVLDHFESDWADSRREAIEILESDGEFMWHHFEALAKTQARYDLSDYMRKIALVILGVGVGASIDNLADKLDDEQMFRVVTVWYKEMLEKILSDSGRSHQDFAAAIDRKMADTRREWVESIRHKLAYIEVNEALAEVEEA